MKDSTEVLQNWEIIKAKERKDRGILEGLPRSLPALVRALRIGEKVSRVGFDWPSVDGSRAKVTEELAELDEAIASHSPDRVEAELGDVLFALVNLARHVGVDPEAALRRTSDEFTATLLPRRDARARKPRRLLARCAAAREARRVLGRSQTDPARCLVSSLFREPPPDATPIDRANAVPPVARLPEEWNAWVQGHGGQKFQGKQIFEWIHKHNVTDAAQMTNLPRHCVQSSRKRDSFRRPSSPPRTAAPTAPASGSCAWPTPRPSRPCSSRHCAA